jgi:hypothetical protein
MNSGNGLPTKIVTFSRSTAFRLAGFHGGRVKEQVFVPIGLRPNGSNIQTASLTFWLLFCLRAWQEV